MQSKLAKFILNSPHSIPMPLGVYAGLEITGASISDVVTKARDQVEAVLALHERFHTQVMLTAMDLSAEAEAFGCRIRMSADEIPTVVGRKVTSDEEIDRLAVPEAGEKRTAVHLETAGRLVSMAMGCPVLGGVIGPFSLASRLFGVSESLLLTLENPDVMEKLLRKSTQFLVEYVLAFCAQGVDGVIMAEPAAGLLSPRGLSRFSSAYIRQIIEAARSEDFTIVLHNCGAKIIHLPKILEAGVEIYHFGAPMDISEALEQVNNDVILAGNLDPSSVFYFGSEEEVTAQTLSLMDRTSGHRNFVPSSGCDIPPHTPVRNLDAFYAAVRKSREGS